MHQYVPCLFAVEQFSTYKSSLNTFLFGLKTKSSDVPEKFDILPSKHDVAIRWTPTEGPSFGAQDLAFKKMDWIQFGNGSAFLENAAKNAWTFATGKAELKPSDVEVLYMDGT